MQTLNGIRDLASRHDVFILDQFGVLHDGRTAYPGAIDTLTRLRAGGARILVLSNSGKRARPNAQRLAKLGFPADCFDHVLTSGEAAWRHLSALCAGSPGLRCHLVSRDGDRSAIDGLPLTRVSSAAEADLILLAASEGDRFSLDDYRRVLEPAARRDIPCICSNPDLIMVDGAERHFGAGQIARLYEELGGTVTWIGKPHRPIYREALALLGDPEPARVVAVGDSIEHDIAGGAGAGLSTALVLTGVAEGADEHVSDATDPVARPDYRLRSFAW